MLWGLLTAGFGVAVLAVPNDPTITPAPLLPRAETPLGWYSVAAATGSQNTSWAPWNFNNDSTIYSTSSKWFRQCRASRTCQRMYTGCSDGFLLAESTSSFCGRGVAPFSFSCGHHLLFQSLGARDPLSWYWCDSPPLTGISIYAKNPAEIRLTSSQIPPFPNSTRTATNSTTNASFISRFSTVASETSSPSPSAAPSLPSPEPETKNKTATAGAIAGSVIGVGAIIAALGIVISVLIKRSNKRSKAKGKEKALIAPDSSDDRDRPPTYYTNPPQSPMQSRAPVLPPISDAGEGKSSGETQHSPFSYRGVSPI
ncbi:hypothetical protein EJ04DRAFT_576285 [Polyplosphaeria fusca]|uniref:Uncharacterized protein n=1 Tax=Polyplosphaeria fusca TaxID=682080 RepID=A0A9P4R2A7_9PLEO|nr:hypothetical protein EJ04DRAFT_576285 [Polyplosphaeria fusca]